MWERVRSCWLFKLVLDYKERGINKQQQKLALPKDFCLHVCWLAFWCFFYKKSQHFFLSSICSSTHFLMFPKCNPRQEKHHVSYPRAPHFIHYLDAIDKSPSFFLKCITIILFAHQSSHWICTCFLTLSKSSLACCFLPSSKFQSFSLLWTSHTSWLQVYPYSKVSFVIK
jgi:hypothetical protein